MKDSRSIRVRTCGRRLNPLAPTAIVHTFSKSIRIRSCYPYRNFPCFRCKKDQVNLSSTSLDMEQTFRPMPMNALYFGLILNYTTPRSLRDTPLLLHGSRLALKWDSIIIILSVGYRRRQVCILPSEPWDQNRYASLGSGPKNRLLPPRFPGFG